MSHYGSILTFSSWLSTVTLALKCGIQGGSTTLCSGSPIVGDGSTKSILGGGTCKQDVSTLNNTRGRHL